MAGESPFLWDVSSDQVTPIDGVGERLVHVIPDLYANALLGNEYLYQDGTGWVRTMDFEQAKQFGAGPDGTAWGVSWNGNPKSVQRDPDTGQASTSTYAVENLEAIAVSDDYGVAWQTGGDGNSSFNPSGPVLVSLVPTLALLALAGDDVSAIIDQWQRLIRELDCGAVSAAAATAARLVCVFTAGQADPTFLVNDQEEPDGRGAAILVDTEARTVESLEWMDAPVVGGSQFAYGGSVYLSWASQLYNTVEIREVDETGYTGRSRSVDMSPWCRNITDFAVTPSGEYGALSCLGEEGVTERQYVGFRMPLF